jgi:hypothetical protein
MARSDFVCASGCSSGDWQANILSSKKRGSITLESMLDKYFVVKGMPDFIGQ